MDNVSWFPVEGVRLGTVSAGIRKPGRKDLVVIELAEHTRVAGVFTRNRFCAAPVQVARAHLDAVAPRYLMINTGYANAGTGTRGMDNCQATCRMLAELTGCQVEQVLPFSTGVIGELFPLAPFESGLPQALAALDGHGWGQAAQGIMTTDTRPKLASRRIEVDGMSVTVTGMAKGSGMIKPNMATMLGFVCTDAGISPALLSAWSRELADLSFNRISVDGDTSTNDACMLAATGRSGLKLDSAEQAGASLLFEALKEVYQELAHAIVRDGEGATKFVQVQVAGAASDEDARQVAETVAHSPLVKTALFASDPNWGRILAAVGRAPVSALDVDRVAIWLGDVQIVDGGGVASGYREQDGARVMAASDINIRIELGLGAGEACLWTCDFSYDYVRINAEYRT